MENIQPLQICKALGNEHRLAILQLLKEKTLHSDEGDIPAGLSVGAISTQIGLSQSTISEFLKILYGCKLIRSKRAGQFTYYSRNETTIKAYANYIFLNL